MNHPILIFTKWAKPACERPGVLTVTINLNADGEIIFLDLKAQPGFETDAAILSFRLGEETVTATKLFNAKAPPPSAVQ